MPNGYQGHQESLLAQDPSLLQQGKEEYGTTWLNALESTLCAQFLPGLLPFAEHPHPKQEFPTVESHGAARIDPSSATASSVYGVKGYSPHNTQLFLLLYHKGGFAVLIYFSHLSSAQTDPKKS